MPSIKEMERLGWGNPNDADFAKKNIINIKPIDGVSIRVHRAAAPIFTQLVRDLNEAGVPIAKKFDDWGYANRDIRGYEGNKSYHAWGLAIDLNAKENQLGSKKTTFPITITRQIVAGLKFVTWGHEWKNRPDPMHFEVHGALAAVKAYANSIK